MNDRQVEIFEIPDVSIFATSVQSDSRGNFTNVYSREIHNSPNLNFNFSSLSFAENTFAGTIRGLHFQTPPFCEEKLIRCLEGEIFDVIVDLRPNSKTVGRWASVYLSEIMNVSLALPVGIAHGYQTILPKSKVFYGLTEKYNLNHSFSLSFNDEELGIKWPLPPTEISSKDKLGLPLDEAIALLAKL